MIVTLDIYFADIFFIFNCTQTFLYTVFGAQFVLKCAKNKFENGFINEKSIALKQFREGIVCTKKSCKGGNCIAQNFKTHSILRISLEINLKCYTLLAVLVLDFR